MKAKIIAFIRRHPDLYRFIKYCITRYSMLREPKLKLTDLTPSEQVIYKKLKKAFK